jgi:transcriptional regulator with XRE-family HTH domain
MTDLIKELPRTDSPDFKEEKRQPTNLISRDSLIRRLKRSPDARTKFVESNLSKELAFQLRALRDNKEWSQPELAERIGTSQNAISRLENPNYGKATITTLKKLAAVFDVGLVVRFVPFSQLVNWESGTPYVEHGLSPETMDVPNFTEELPKLERKAVEVIDAEYVEPEPVTLTNDFENQVAMLFGRLSEAEWSGPVLPINPIEAISWTYERLSLGSLYLADHRQSLAKSARVDVFVPISSHSKTVLAVEAKVPPSKQNPLSILGNVPKKESEAVTSPGQFVLGGAIQNQPIQLPN